MQTKSNIQLVREALAVKEAFCNVLEQLTDKYIVKNSVFEFDGRNLSEVTSGYMTVKGEYSSLNEAFKNYQIGDAVRIIENSTYQLGKVYKTLSEANSDKVYSITFDEMVSE